MTDTDIVQLVEKMLAEAVEREKAKKQDVVENNHTKNSASAEKQITKSK